MSEHRVHCELPAAEILNKDAKFDVSADEVHFGRLTVSRGGVGWFPANAPAERHLSWEKFDKLIQDHFSG